MPNLETFWAANNKIKNVTGLCLSIKWLVLNNNEIGVNAHENFNMVKQMVNLSKLELGMNGIKSLDQPKHLFAKLTKLTALILADIKYPLELPGELSFFQPAV